MKSVNDQGAISDVNSFLRDHVMVTQSRQVFEHCVYLFGQVMQQLKPEPGDDNDFVKHVEQIERLMWQIQRQCEVFAATPQAVRVFADVKMWDSLKGFVQAAVSLIRSGHIVATPPCFGEASFLRAIAKLPQWQRP